MNGQALVDLLTSILDNESIDQTFALQMINVARGYIEDRQPLVVFKKLDISQVVGSANSNGAVPINVPSDFRRYIPAKGAEGGSIQLFNGGSLINDLIETAFQDQLTDQKYYGKYYVDYGQGLLYVLGQIPGTFTVYQFYIADYGNITLSTQWGQTALGRVTMPARYHPMLAYEAAAMWRLGTDYDNTAARNADDNAKRSDMIYKALLSWNTELTLSEVGKKDYVGDSFGGNNAADRGPRGVRFP